MTSCPIPKHPDEAGTAWQVPELAQIEGAHLLANRARPFLKGCGFTDRQILAWADTYIANVGSGDVDSFVEWIHEREAVLSS
ncbi:MAG: hypothetical protein HKN91_16340 [Acidimicrobiia bacterium]|nr:hypothetical protein [Acidimicrobiia bacterium]